MAITFYMTWCFSHAAFSIFSLTFGSLVICLREELFGLNLWDPLNFMDLDVHISPRIGKFSTITLLNKLSLPFFISSSSCQNANICSLMVSHKCHSLLHSFFFSLPLTGLFQKACFQVQKFFCLIYFAVEALNCIFYFILWIFWPQDLCLVLSYDISLFVEFLIQVMNCFSGLLNDLFVFFHASPSFLKLTILNSFSGNS